MRGVEREGVGGRGERGFVGRRRRGMDGWERRLVG